MGWIPTVKPDALSLLVKSVWAAPSAEGAHMAERLEKRPAEINVLAV